MAQSGSNKVATGLVSASCAAVLAVYAAGYVRTQSAAERFAAQVAERRPALHDSPPAAGRIKESSAPVPETPKHKEKPKMVAAAEPLPAAAVEAGPVEAPDPAPPVPEPAAAPVSAPAPEPAPALEVKPEPAPAAPPPPVWKDGTYTGWGYSRHGNIEAAVVIEGGRIASATISQCRTRYSCSVIDRLPPQVAQRQSPDVDYVSGATQSADAFYGAVVAALAKAK